MSTFDFTSPLYVLAGTIYGEARGCGRAAMENVAACVLNRVGANWDRGGVIGVCLAPWQFSSWNESDPNRQAILNAAVAAFPPAEWPTAMAVASSALAGQCPNRIGGADSYFAATMKAPPYWAKYPAIQTYSDGWHKFWRTRASSIGAPSAPAVSTHALPTTTDELNAAEIGQIKGDA